MSNLPEFDPSEEIHRKYVDGKKPAASWGGPLAGLVWIGVFAIAAVYYLRENRPPPAKVASVAIGSIVTLKAQAGHIPIATDVLALDEIAQAAEANDEIGLVELIDTGRVFLVKSGTEAKLLATGHFRRRVRILQGEHRNRAGWVEARWVD